MKKRKWMLLLQITAVLALATGLAAPVQAAEVDTTRGAALTVSLAEDDVTDADKSIVADLSNGGVRQFTAELYRVGSYTADGSLTSEPDFTALHLETVVEEALTAYENQQAGAAATPTPNPAEPALGNGHIPGSVWQTVWENKAEQASELIGQKRLQPTQKLLVSYETCTNTTARYIGTAKNLVCGLYLVRLPALNGAAYHYSTKDYLLSVPYNASQDLSVPQTQPDVWEYEVTSYPKLDRHSYPTPTPRPVPTSTPGKEKTTTPGTGLGGHLPKTGDSSQPLLWLVLMLAAGTGLVLVLVKKHKDNGGNNK